MEWIDSPGEILALLGIIGTILGVLFFIIDVRVGKVLKELKPNGGESFSDRLQQNHREIRDELLSATERIERKIDKHIGWHMDRANIERENRGTRFIDS